MDKPTSESLRFFHNWMVNGNGEAKTWPVENIRDVARMIDAVRAELAALWDENEPTANCALESSGESVLAATTTTEKNERAIELSAQQWLEDFDKRRSADAARDDIDTRETIADLLAMVRRQGVKLLRHAESSATGEPE